MGDAVIEWLQNTFLSVEFISTVVGLVVGSWWISRTQARRASEEDTLRWFAGKVEWYSELARSYWSGMVNPDPIKCSEIESQLKVEIKFFYPALNHVRMVDARAQKKIKSLIRSLYHAATGRNFETGRKIDFRELRVAHLAIADASAELRKVIYESMTC